jgi:di/tricarboxylate transporter
MLAEIGILCVLSGAIWFFPWSAGKQLLASALLAAAVCWLHVVFLPMLISALYMGFLLLLGRFLQHLFLRRERGRFAVHADVFLESGNSFAGPGSSGSVRFGMAGVFPAGEQRCDRRILPSFRGWAGTDLPSALSLRMRRGMSVRGRVPFVLFK